MCICVPIEGPEIELLHNFQKSGVPTWIPIHSNCCIGAVRGDLSFSGFWKNSHGDFQKFGRSFLGGPMIMLLRYWGLYWGLLFLELPCIMQSTCGVSCRDLGFQS